jgi:predicted metalloprotease with PDZ domain
MILKNPEKDSVVFSMPVWSPGSYLIREFSKNVENVIAENTAGDKLHIEKINKNSWTLKTENQNEIRLRYKVYCNEPTVRSSQVNSSHAFISNAGMFMFARGFENRKCILKINLPPEWKKISTGLNKESDNIYSAENYDAFIDCPVEIGNQNILEFEIRGVRHYICLTGRGNYKEDILINDFKKIAEEEIKLFEDDIPYKDYTFIIQLAEKGGGGLEHHNSFVGGTSSWNFNDEKLYKKFLGLVSHEFFHLWNVKRIRPSALGPFDYDNENYTKNLWVAEGWTSFYDDLILRRSNILSDEEYFEFIDTNVNDIMKYCGRFNQSLAESSFDTWIKYYRKDENYNNSQVSYYTKGALAAMMLNIEIIKNTNADKSLDDVMRTLYDDYKKDDSKGYSDERIKEICVKVNGKSLDDFWKKYVSGTDELPLQSYLNECGLELINESESGGVSFDIETKEGNGKYIVTKVFAGGTGYESGLNFNDEIIAVNDTRVDSVVVSKLLKDYKTGDEVRVLISRAGNITELPVKFLEPLPKYKIKMMENKSEVQQRYFDKWING